MNSRNYRVHLEVIAKNPETGVREKTNWSGVAELGLQHDRILSIPEDEVVLIQCFRTYFSGCDSIEILYFAEEANETEASLH